MSIFPQRQGSHLDLRQVLDFIDRSAFHLPHTVEVACRVFVYGVVVLMPYYFGNPSPDFARIVRWVMAEPLEADMNEVAA